MIRRRLPHILVVSVVVAVALAGTRPTPAAGQLDVNAVIEQIPVESARHSQAVARLAETERVIVESRRIIDEAETLLEELTFAASRLAETVPVLVADVERASGVLDRARQDRIDLALLGYVAGGPTAELDAVLLGEEGVGEREGAYILLRLVQELRLDAEEFARRRLGEAEAARDEANNGLADFQARITEQTQRRDRARDALAQGEAALPALRDEVIISRRLAPVRGTDITLVTFEAYLRASDAANRADPDCRLPWWLLAGIGRVESIHGTFGGAEVRPDGSITRPIIGIPLNGENQTRVITDTDQGRLDGDTVYDRAVGPMQFIPTTWAAFAADGNGDGVSDPQHLFDATRAAAAYLCRTGELDQPDRLRTAILRYNQSQVYVDNVLRFGQGYRDAVGLG